MLFEIPWPKKKGSEGNVSDVQKPEDKKETSEPPRHDEVDPREAGIIVGGEPETYPAERQNAPEPVRTDGIVSAEDRSEYSLEEKISFLSAWTDELSGMANGIENLSPEHVFNTIRAEDATLVIDWDEGGDVRLTWIRKSEEGEPSKSEAVTDIMEIAEAFPLAVLETVFDRAKDVLEYNRKRQELRKGGPKPLSAESEA
ncbi:MAG: hypothetical protein HGB37_04950 [Candidatus Moranbacteria bacterium]|nr:hypothetical protein [Candidatus Moranbacteria bacterium]